ncbi:MAG: hypothetical protein ACREFW_02340 [Rhizomicrobium sp.]
MSSSYLDTRDLKRLQQLGAVVLIAGAIMGLIKLGDLDRLAGYLLILMASAAPMFFWLRKGAMGLPILPLTALGYFVYYGMPVIDENSGRYTPAEILAAAVTVAIFLGAATLSWRLVAFRHSGRFDRDRALHLERALPNLMLSALLLAATFQIGDRENWLSFLGPWYGAFDSLALSAAAVGCFLFGAALGRRQLSAGQKWAGSLLITVLTILQITSLIMHGAILFLAAVLIGFVLSAKRIPWLAMAAFTVAASLLHMSEGRERQQYWTRSDPDVSVMEMPSMLVGWFGAAIGEIGNGTADENRSLAARATQLSTLLLVEGESPQNIPFLEGATYANFPRMLIPRFLSPDKLISQANLHLLSVYYHLQDAEDTETTTISWNLVPEAYANFGNIGAFFSGLVFGLLTGGIAFITSGAPLISLRGLVGLAALVTLLDVEYDFSYLMLNLLQAMFSISMFYFALKFLEPRPATYPARAPHRLVQ